MNPKKRVAPFTFKILTAVKALLTFIWLMSAPSAVSAAPPNFTEMARWITQMKADSRGPFDGIYWFCKDREILPPQPYACSAHGGGTQHGRWSERTRSLRESGYLVGNVLAATDADALATEPEK